ncbi:MAG: hypothetical protein NTX07_01480 [Solirubrobacterales bacterium]|nr:hypothetical protein [Solirubrobacterales bacterium]
MPAEESEFVTAAHRYLGLDWFEWICFAALAGLSMVVLGPLLLKGRVLSGADGLFPPDQLQYLTWIREAGDHWLIGNRFDMRTDHRVFLHPGFLLSGLVHRWLGASLAEGPQPRPTAGRVWGGAARHPVLVRRPRRTVRVVVRPAAHPDGPPPNGHATGSTGRERGSPVRVAAAG